MPKRDDGTRWGRRDRKRRKEIHGMRMDGRSIKTVILDAIKKRLRKANRR